MAETPQEASEQPYSGLLTPHEYIHCRRIPLLNLAPSVIPSPSLYSATLEGLRGYFINLIILPRRKLRLRKAQGLVTGHEAKITLFMIV